MGSHHDIINFIHNLTYEEIPDSVRETARLLCLDLIAVASAGRLTKLSEITQTYVAEEMSGDYPILFSDVKASATGSAYANAAMIDSFDAHDGQVLCKGHIGVTILPVIIACYGDFISGQSQKVLTKKMFSENELGKEIIVSLVIGYELGSRLGIALHQSAKDYHTSGAWNSIAGAAIASRAMGLNDEETWHALGIAEFYGPRSPMMRCIDYPTMLKDGSSMGALVAISSAIQASLGFTGAPALTMSGDDGKLVFNDLSKRWYTNEQYLKYYPVCRWAQPAVEAALVLANQSNFSSDNIESIEITTFHQAKRLFNGVPMTTEQAQYGLSMPFACALLHKDISAKHIIELFNDASFVEIIKKITIHESDEFNQVFPEQRWASVTIKYSHGLVLESGHCRTKGDFDNPYSEEEIIQKARSLLNLQKNESQTHNIINHCLSLGIN